MHVHHRRPARARAHLHRCLCTFGVVLCTCLCTCLCTAVCAGTQQPDIMVLEHTSHVCTHAHTCVQTNVHSTCLQHMPAHMPAHSCSHFRTPAYTQVYMHVETNVQPISMHRGAAAWHDGPQPLAACDCDNAKDAVMLSSGWHFQPLPQYFSCYA